MLNAWPNQKIPSRIINIRGRTAAASAISAPVVSAMSRENIVRAKFVILYNSPELEKSVEHYRQRQRHSLGNFKRVWVIERYVSAGQPECYQRNQDVSDIAQSLQQSPFVDYQCQSHRSRHENRSNEHVHQAAGAGEGAESHHKLQVSGAHAAQQIKGQQQAEAEQGA